MDLVRIRFMFEREKVHAVHDDSRACFPPGDFDFPKGRKVPERPARFAEQEKDRVRLIYRRSGDGETTAWLPLLTAGECIQRSRENRMPFLLETDGGLWRLVASAEPYCFSTNLSRERQRAVHDSIVSGLGDSRYAIEHYTVQQDETIGDLHLVLRLIADGDKRLRIPANRQGDEDVARVLAEFAATI